MAAEGLPVEKACLVLGVSVSGYYSWLRWPPSPRSVRHAWLTDVISRVHADSRQTYGSKRVHAELTLGLGIAVCRQTVETLMRRAGCGACRAARSTAGPPTQRQRRTSSTATSPAGSRIGCGWPTSPSAPPGRARCTALWCSICSAAESSAGRSTRGRSRRWSPTL